MEELDSDGRTILFDTIIGQVCVTLPDARDVSETAKVTVNTVDDKKTGKIEVIMLDIKYR